LIPLNLKNNIHIHLLPKPAKPSLAHPGASSLFSPLKLFLEFLIFFQVISHSVDRKAVQRYGSGRAERLAYSGAAYRSSAVDILVCSIAPGSIAIILRKQM